MKFYYPYQLRKFISVPLIMLVCMSVVNLLQGQPLADGAPAASTPNFQYEAGFVQNRGQIRDQHNQPNPEVRYLWNGSGIKVQLRANGFSYDTWVMETDSVKLAAYHANPEAAGATDTLRTRMHRVDISFPGANPNPQLIAAEELESKINVIGGGNHNFEAIKQYGKVTYKNLYPGIDLEFYAHSGTDKPIEYNFIVHPGARADLIRMAYAGANTVSLSDEGSIRLSLSTEDLEEVIPASWTGEARQPLRVSYRAHGEGVFGFAVPDYDPAQTLTIDPAPVLGFGTYMHVNHFTYMPIYGDIKIDAVGNVYVAFVTRNAALPSIATSGAYQTNVVGTIQWVLSKFNAGGQLLISTYYHNGTNQQFNDQVSATLNGTTLYLVGATSASGMETAGMNPLASEAYDLLITGFSTSNLYPIWATYFGGTRIEIETNMDVDNEGNLLISYYSNSGNLPVTPPLDEFTIVDGINTFCIAKFNASGQRILSGPVASSSASTTVGRRLRVKAAQDNGFVLYGGRNNGDVLFTAWSPTNLSNVPLGTESYRVNTVVGRYDSDGNRLWASYVQNISPETSAYSFKPRGNALVVDNDGRIWVAGETPVWAGYGGPITPNALYPVRPDFMSGFALTYLPHLISINPDGNSLYYGSLHYPGLMLPETGYLTSARSSGPIQLHLDKSSGDLVFFQQFNFNYSPDDIAPCADGFSSSLVISKFSTSMERRWATATGLPTPVFRSYLQTSDVNNSRIALLYWAFYNVISNTSYEETMGFYDQLLTTPGAHRREPYARNNFTTPPSFNYQGFILTTFDEFQGIPEGLQLSENTLSPLTQTACINGLPQTITGTKVTVQQPRGTDISLSYQWQIADAPTGPWANVSGATGKNYTPRPLASGQKYFRRIVTALNAECMLAGIDTSGVSALLLRNDIAPNAEAGNPKYYLCPGDAITLNGSASGGSGSGYQYEWYIGGATSPAQTGTEFTHSPSATVVYTLRVTDDAGCFAIDQVAVEPVRADAGPDVTFCQGSSGVKIGGTPIQGTSLVNYQWNTDARLSCTACPQPVAVVSAGANFFLQVNVTRKDGTQCFTRDTVAVGYVALPGGIASFAGADRTICYGSGTSLGTEPVAGYTFSWQPSVFLSSAVTVPATYSNNTTVVNNPLRYQLKATRGSCSFVDYVDVNTVYGAVLRDINVSSGCGPVWYSQLQGTNPVGTTYSWVKTGGAGTLVILATRNDGADAYLKASGGSVSFKRVTTYNGVSCDSEIFTLNVNCPCENLSVSVSGAAGCASPAAVPYTVTVAGVDMQNKRIRWTPAYAFSNDSILSPTIITTDNITITATVTDKYDPGTICSYTLLINRPNLAVPVFELSNITTCPNVPVSIGLANNPSYTYEWANITGMADPNTDKYQSNPTVRVGTTQEYTVKVTHVSSGCSITDTMRVIVTNVSVNAGSDQTVCLNETITIGTPPPAGTSYTYSWSPAGSAWTNGTGPTDAMPDLIAGQATQTLVLTAFDEASGCSRSDTVVIRGTNEVPLPALTNQSICPGSQTIIGGLGSNGISYQWIPATGLDCPTCPNTLASPEETTTYTLVATGCGSTSSAGVTVTVFTPEDYTLEDREVCPQEGGEIGIGAVNNTSGLSNVASFNWSPQTSLSCSNLSESGGNANCTHTVHPHGAL